jgi:hypothetical protein
MFRITESGTPVLYQQTPAVQHLAVEFNQDYNSKNNVKVRRGFGVYLEQIHKGQTLAKNAQGKEMDGKSTFTAICRELGIARSSAYGYIATHIACSNYPQAIQDAAADAGLNLAQDHVVAEYVKLKGAGEAGVNPAQPTSVEARGVVSLLADAPNPNKKTVSHKSGADRFQELLNEAFEYAEEEELDAITVANVAASTVTANINDVDAVSEVIRTFRTANGWTIHFDASGKAVAASAPL